MSTSPRHIALVCAPAGSGFKQAVARLRTLLSAELGETAVACEDVEDVFCESGATATALKGLVTAGTRVTMKEVTWHLTRTDVTRLWRSALSDTIARLCRAEKAKIRLLACHLNLYGGRRGESYSPFDLNALRDVKVSHLLLFIDDIFDMYARLSTEGHLYDQQAHVARYITRMKDDEALQPSSVFDSATTQDLALEWKTQVLASLLGWRHAEMILAESLASQLDAHYLVFGTKQLGTAVTRWLRDREGNSVYLSHPISRPRRVQQRTGAWPEVVAQFNGLQELLVEERVTAIMPTAIDEYRFKRATKPTDLELTPRLTSLATRWPIPVDASRTLYESGSPEAPELSSLFTSDVMEDGPHWSPWIRTLESQITAEVPFRDHHLVVCNHSILIFRPCYEAGRFSDGVKAEVGHWAELLKSTGRARRRAVFLHFHEDVQQVLSVLDPSLEQLSAKTLIRELVAQGYSDEVAGELAKAVLQDSAPTLLDAGHDPTDVKRARELFDVVHRKAIGNALTLDQIDEEAVALWIVRDYADLVDKLPAIGAFLRFEPNCSPTKWWDLVEALLSLRAGSHSAKE